MLNKDKYKSMKTGGKYLAEILSILSEKIKPNISTQDIENWTIEFLKKNDIKSAFLGFGGYPKNICVSINDEIVHGVPNSNKIIHDGDLVSLDMGINYNGYMTDMATTVAVGKITDEEKRLLEGTEMALTRVISEIKTGDRVGKIGQIIAQTAKEYNLKIIYELTGHGVGKKLHEDPIVYNYGNENNGPILNEGATIAIEPMFSLGSSKIITKSDKWTYSTQDGSKAAHFEKTIMFMKNGVEVLTKM
ncbi:MAG: type I methionyl aminopeptidase [Patescibacteria group bacterium]|jgi:methionyl aminopeptidase